MSKIQYVFAREILDSRGHPTVECSIWLDNGQMVSSSAPSGTSLGTYEAHELRDNDPHRLFGMGVSKAVNNINTVIGPRLIGQDPTSQEELDQLMIQLDGSPNKTNLGANALVATSQAITKAGAAASGMQLYQYIWQKCQLCPQPAIPTMVYTLINGGSHGASNLDIQEFQIVPASNKSYPESIEMATVLFHQLEQVLISKEAFHSVGIVGGFAPNLYNNTDAFEILIETVKTTPYTYAQDLFMGVDMAASNLFDRSKYHLKDKTQPYSAQEFLEYYHRLRKLYHVVYIEDPFQEDDSKWWQQLIKDIGETTTIVGDDLVVTNPEQLAKAITDQTANAISVKPNQIGTITETINVIRQARAANWHIVIAHRSGETTDTFMADFCVGIGAEYGKFGPPNRGERVAKYNRLSEIHLYLQPQGTPA